MHKSLIVGLFTIGLFVIGGSAHADGNYDVCDQTPPISAFNIQAAWFTDCASTPTPETLTFYGLEWRPSSLGGGTPATVRMTLFRTSDGAVLGYEDISTASLVLGSSNYTEFTTPVVIPASTTLDIAICNTSGTACNGQGIQSEGQATPTVQNYGVWDFGPEPDDNESTHVIRINSPLLGATTTSPVTVDFDWYQGTPAFANGYRIVFTQTTAGAYLEDRVFFGATVPGTNNDSYTTSLPVSGTWKVEITLLDGSPDIPSAPVQYFTQPSFDGLCPGTATCGNASYFGINYNDNWQTIEFGAPSVTYASTSCALDWSLSFNVGDCAGYLFYPTQTTAIYQSIPATLNTKVPFGYVGQIAGVWEDLQVADGEPPSIEFDFADAPISSSSPLSIGNLVGNVTVFSEETVTHFMPEGWLPLMKTLMGTVLVIAGFTSMYATARFAFSPKHT